MRLAFSAEHFPQTLLTSSTGWAHSAPMPNDEITTREALDILGLAHPSSITHLVAEHKLKPSRRMPGKRGAYLFRRAHIERLRDERAASGAA